MKSSPDKKSLLEALTDNVPALLSYVNKDYKYEYVNKKYLSFLEKKENQIIGHTVLDVLGKTAGENIIKNIKKAIETGKKVTNKAFFPELPSGPKWLDATFIPDKIKGEKTPGVFVLVIDVTEQTLEKERLIEREERLLLASKARKLGTYDWKILENDFYWGEMLYEIMGVNAQDNIDKKELFFSRIHPDDVDRVQANFQSFFSNEVKDLNYFEEFKIIVPNDGTKHIENRGYCIRDKKNNITRLVGAFSDVTEQKLTENSLKSSEERLALIYNSTTEQMGLVEIDSNGSFIFVSANTASRNAYKNLGLSEKDYFNNTLTKFYKEHLKFSDKELEELLSNYKQVAEDKKPIFFESSIQIEKGKKVYIETTLFPIFDKQGEITHILWSNKDKTLTHTSEQKIKDSEERLSLIYNGTFDMIALFKVEDNNKFIFESINDAFFKIALKNESINAKDQILGKNVEDVLRDNLKMPNKKIKERIDLYNAIVKQKKGRVEETETQINADFTLYQETTFTPILDDKKHVTHLLLIIKDITEKTKVADQVKENEKQLSAVFNNTLDMMVLLHIEDDDHMYIDTVNDKFFEFTNRFIKSKTKDDLFGKDLGEVYIACTDYESVTSAKAESLDLIKEAITLKKTFIHETTVPLKDGATVINENSVIPILDDNGDCRQVLLMIKDITKRKLAEKKLVQAYAELDRLKEKFEKENIYLQEEIMMENNFENMVYSSFAFRNILNQVEQVSVLDATVLITGETGTGKELISRAIHNLSKRKDSVMVKLNCGAIPKDLVESELFGHEKGSFTGAISKKIGKFEFADGGTIFLDEIGEMPLDIQVKLLRVLQEGEYERVGGTEPVTTNVRVIAATNRDLKKEVEKGNFREDLYYRLNVFPIHIPALRERPEDIAPLVEYFINKFSKKHGKVISYIPQDAMDGLRAHDWPGNVRELENYIERAMIVSQNETLTFPDINLNEKSDSESQNEMVNTQDLVPQTLNEIERIHILKVLKSCNWVIGGSKGAAIALNLKPSTLRDRMKKLNIKRPAK